MTDYQKVDPITATNSQEASDMWHDLFEYLADLTFTENWRVAAAIRRTLTDSLKGEQAEQFRRYHVREGRRMVQAFKLGLVLGRRYDANRLELIRDAPTTNLPPFMKMIPENDLPEPEKRPGQGKPKDAAE